MNRAASLLIAATALAAAAPATASPYGASVAPRGVAFTKSDAILGKPSSLAAILASQGAAPAPAPSPSASAATYRTFAAAVPRIAPDDRPDVFGSVALPIRRASLERHWAKVGETAVGSAAAAFVDGLDGLTDIERLDAVNRYVNGRVEFADDRRQFGTADLWLAASETLRRGRGDCEDYAIAKMQMLRRAGFADKDLYLVILHDVARRADHAVLVARADGRLLVLDNGTNRIVDSDSLPDYRPILTFSGDRRWTHGYRREPAAPVQLAEAPAEQAQPAPITDTVALAAVSLPAVALSMGF
ncbi:transglutaminase-like cysteine peptidase [Sphingomonas mesophila]|uniref:transglutaminase-like cysteine peptidase n=1 Tax=Sphingomonas mesophila TaxID=2303576 RepID=UPI000E5738CF|nr:transglutaminase-like cysteine peptidase [Sphingomonas mesophila]